MSICFEPIGIVHVNFPDEVVKDSISGVEGVIEIYPDYADGLNGIEGFSHIIAIFYLHKVTVEQRKVLRVKHRRLKRFGVDISNIPEVGVFCTDSPHRPNPIALTILELVERKSRFLKVKGLDVFDGTPVLDIKAYSPHRVVKNFKVPNWVWDIWKIIESLRKRRKA